MASQHHDNNSEEKSTWETPTNLARPSLSENILVQSCRALVSVNLMCHQRPNQPLHTPLAGSFIMCVVHSKLPSSSSSSSASTSHVGLTKVSFLALPELFPPQSFGIVTKKHEATLKEANTKPTCITTYTLNNSRETRTGESSSFSVIAKATFHSSNKVSKYKLSRRVGGWCDIQQMIIRCSVSLFVISCKRNGGCCPFYD